MQKLQKFKVSATFITTRTLTKEIMATSLSEATKQILNMDKKVEWKITSKLLTSAN